MSSLLFHAVNPTVSRAVTLRDAPSVLRARDAIERLESEAPELTAALERYRSARIALINRLHTRAAELGINEGSDAATATAVENEPVYFEGRAINWLGVMMFVFIGVVMSVVGWNQRGVALVWLAVAGIVVALVVGAQKLRVTQRSLIIGAQRFAVKDVTCVVCRRVERRSFRSGRTTEFHVVVERGEASDTIRMQLVPDGFTSALVMLGVPVRHE